MSTQSRLAGRGKGLSLLSLDAGGTRSISQLKILAEIMHRWNYGTNEEQMDRPHAIFDMIGGVGSGGFIAILLVIFKLTAEEVLEEFIHLAVNVLDKQGLDVETRTTTLKEYIDKILNKYGINPGRRLLDHPDQPTACKLVVPISHKQHIGSICTLRNHAIRQEQPLNLTIAEALLATLSTPPHFAPLSIVKDAATFEYTSAEWTLSNPTQEILTEAHAAFATEERVACLLSLGCGHPGVFAAPENPDSAEWNRVLERLAIDGERKAQSLESQMGPLGIYRRFGVTTGLDKSKSLLNPGEIVTHTAVYLADITVSRGVDFCVDSLKVRDGVSSLEQLKHSGGQHVLSPQLPPLTKTFVMRKEPWDFIHSAMLGPRDPSDIDGPRMLFVTGMGGCGKTQLMLRFMKVHEAEFTFQFLIDGSSEDRIRADIIRSVRAIGNENSQKGFEECLLFLSQPSRNGQILLLYDNVDDPDINLSALFPRGDSCVIATTSRNHLLGVSHPNAHLQLDAMSLEEATELLLHPSSRITITDRDREQVASLARALGCLPIALQQARSYMQQTQCSSSTYLERLSSSRRKLLGPAISFQTGMQSISTYAAFETSFARLALRVQQFLRLLSYFHWNKFPLELIVLAAKYRFSEYLQTYVEHDDAYYTGKSMLENVFLCDGEWDPVNLDGMTVSLQNYSFITIIPGVGTTLLHMHPLLHEWLQMSIPEEEGPKFESASILLLAIGAHDKYTAAGQYLPSHVTHMNPLWDGLNVNNAAAFGLVLCQNGIFQGALQLQERVVRELRLELDANSIRLAESIGTLAMTYRESGRLHESAILLEEVTKLRKERLGDRHLDTLATLGQLGRTYYLQGRLSEAEVLQEEVLTLSKEILGERHSSTTDASNNLAMTYAKVGQLSKAKVLQEEALKLSKEILGERHPDTIASFSNLAATYYDLGRLTEAEVLQEKAVELNKKILGRRHPDTIRSLNNLAVTYANLGRLNEALALQEEVLTLRKEILGERHPGTINVSINLAMTYFQLGRLNKAEELQEEMLKLSNDVLGERHHTTTAAMLNLARTYISRGRKDGAIELLHTVEGIISETLAVTHPQHLVCQRLKAEARKVVPSPTSSRPLANVHWYTKIMSRKYFSKSRSHSND